MQIVKSTQIYCMTALCRNVVANHRADQQNSEQGNQEAAWDSADNQQLQMRQAGAALQQRQRQWYVIWDPIANARISL